MTQGQERDGGAPGAQPDGGADEAAMSVSAAHDAVLSEPRYQFSPSDPPPPPEPSWLERLLNTALGRLIGDILSTVFEIAFWVGLVALAGLVLWYAGQAALGALSRRRTRDRADEAPAPYQPGAATVRTLLEDAARLAKDGRYGDAVRLILRRSIEDMERQRPGAVRDAMTSREIARLPILTEAGRKAFARIAALVERAAFAGRALTRDEYEEARGIYEALNRRLLQAGA